jgi:hypothetical protein
VDEYRLPLQAVGLRAADVHRARRLGRSGEHAPPMPASSHASLTTVPATDWPAAMPPPTRLSSIPGSIAFVALRLAIHIMMSPSRRTTPLM